jgi:peptidyl-dipeptidase Dcp
VYLALDPSTSGLPSLPSRWLLAGPLLLLLTQRLVARDSPAQLVDQALHSLPQEAIDSLDLATFEREELERLHMPEGIVMRHRPPHFLHLFASSGYAAMYYVYRASLALAILRALGRALPLSAGRPVAHPEPDGSRLAAAEWAEVLDADAFDTFLETGDVFDQPTAARLRKWVYSSGNSVEPGEAYRQFKGRDATVEPMMRNKGLLEVAA